MIEIMWVGIPILTFFICMLGARYNLFSFVSRCHCICHQVDKLNDMLMPEGWENREVCYSCDCSEQTGRVPERDYRLLNTMALLLRER